MWVEIVSFHLGIHMLHLASHVGLFIVVEIKALHLLVHLRHIVHFFC